MADAPDGAPTFVIEHVVVTQDEPLHLREFVEHYLARCDAASEEHQRSE